MFISFSAVLDIVVRSCIVYAVIVAGIRLGGKREIGQMTIFDFVMLLLIANAVQNAMVGQDTSLAGGIIAAGTLLGMNMILSYLAWHSKRMRLFIEGSPALLINDGVIVQKNLEKEKITKEVLAEALREHGVENVSDVKCAVLEMDGAISVIRFDEMPNEQRPHHRIRSLPKRS